MLAETGFSWIAWIFPKLGGIIHRIKRKSLKLALHWHFSILGGYLRDGPAAPRHYDEDGKLPEAPRTKERSVGNRQPCHPRQGETLYVGS